MKKSIGIIGAGFVGKAIKHAYESCGIPVIVNDPLQGFNATYEEILTCDAVFVCVPSPGNPDGSCNTGILEHVLAELREFKGVIISKVTAPPSVYSRLGQQYTNLVHVPEFLVANTADSDYLNGTIAYIGGKDEEYLLKAEKILRLGQQKLHKINFCSIDEASLLKYTVNAFLATKVSFMNQIYQLSTGMGIEYPRLVNLLSDENRIGSSHMLVPGTDGKFGFGGACFPKDTEALIYEAKNTGVDISVLEAAVEYNKTIRN